MTTYKFARSINLNLLGKNSVIVTNEVPIVNQARVARHFFWAGGANSDGQKLTKKLATNSLTNFFSYTNSLTIKK